MRPQTDGETADRQRDRQEQRQTRAETENGTDPGIETDTAQRSKPHRVVYNPLSMAK